MSQLSQGYDPRPRKDAYVKQPAVNPGRSGRQMDSSGIAIVTVILILASVMVLGIASMVLTRSNLLISENQVTSSIARSHANAGIDATVAMLFDIYKDEGRLPEVGPSLPSVTGLGGTVTFSPASGTWYDRRSDDQVALRIAGQGPRNAQYVAEALAVFTSGGGGGTSPFQGGLIACESATFSSSAGVDSFDSRVGPYSASSRGYEGNIITLSDDGSVSISSSARVYGDVFSRGDLTAGSSATVYGHTYANGDVTASSSAQFRGSVNATGSVSLGSSASVLGNLLANGDLSFSSSAQARGPLVQVGGSISIPKSSSMTTHIPTGTVRQNDSPAVQPPASEECDPLDIVDVMSAFEGAPVTGSIKASSSTDWLITPSQVMGQPKSSDPMEDRGLSTVTVDVFGQLREAYKLSDFDMASSATVRISGGDVILIIDGDFDAGSSSKLRIDDGSTLTVFVTGKFDTASSFRLEGTGTGKAPPPVNSNGDTVFTVYSSYSGNKGVNISSSANLTANVYAPLTDAKYSSSSDLLGAIRARNIDISSSGGVHFDVALRDVTPGSDPSGGEPTVTIVSRR